jgi:trans-AT polyketide synthase, acyltransferase and oxidoreductase domains
MLAWQGPADSIVFEADKIRDVLLDLDRPCYVVRYDDRLGVTAEGTLARAGQDVVGLAPALPPGRLGDPSFALTYDVRYAYMAGAMANGIASEALVRALGEAGVLSSFGAAGLLPVRIEEAVRRLQALPTLPFACNLIHSPNEEALEARTVAIYLDHRVRIVEASAFLELTRHVVRYRAAGLSLDGSGNINIANRIIAKVSRREVAQQFLSPAPAELLRGLASTGLITPLQASLAEHVPVADDLTVEADSAGHTDNRPLITLLPSILALRDELQGRRVSGFQTRVGAAGGIGTPASALAAYTLGAAYVVTGSINQACIESGTSSGVRAALAEAGMADVMMAPAADMFEMGVRVQVLKRGTLFPMRAQKLFELYRTYASLDALPPNERETLEQRLFRCSLSTVWDETERYFAERDPDQLLRAADNPKRKMALAFRWYLGLSSKWANTGALGREMDYQVWCGPAMGAFNDWARGSYLEDPVNRSAVDVAEHMITGAAYLARLQMLAYQGVRFDNPLRVYTPMRRVPATW